MDKTVATMTLATGKNNRASQLSSGFTLVEVLLVLALLVIGGAIVVPSLNGSFSRSELKQAAAELRRTWGEARLEAIKTGKPLVFRCQIGSDWGYVGSMDAPTPLGPGQPGTIESTIAEADSESSAGTSTAGTSTNDFQMKEIVFRELLVADRPGASAIGAGVGEGELSAIILFRPDGVTSEAEATLEAANGKKIRVTLRGLTGSTRVVDEVPTP